MDLEKRFVSKASRAIAPLRRQLSTLASLYHDDRAMAAV
jgi:hypothetical protein